MSQQPLPKITDLILHRSNMLLLDRVLTFQQESTTAEYTPQRHSWYADQSGNMPAWIGLELMAQTIAAHVGLDKRNKDSAPKQGVLLGTRSYSTSVPSFNYDEPLLIQANMVFIDESGLAAYDCTITNSNKDIIATATLKAFEPPNFQLFLQEASQ